MQQNNQFSNDKLFFHTEKLRSVLNNEIVEPIVYELSLSGFCNCKCTYCCCQDYHTNQMLAQNDIDLLVKQLKESALAVTITGGGEPLTNPNIAYCIQQFKKNGISVGIISNGLLLDDEIIKAIALNTSFFRISLDTVDSYKYKQMRGIDVDFAKLSHNLKLLSKQKKKLQSKVLLGTQIVYTDQSIQDLENTIKFSKESGIDFVQIRPVDNIPNRFIIRNYNFYNQNRTELKQLKDKYTDRFFQVLLNEKFDEYYSENVKKEYNQCLGGNFTAAIGHDMNLYFCCAHIGDPRFLIGNLRQKNLQELLQSEKRRNFIEHLCQKHCQIQCRNHRMNKLLHHLKHMDTYKRNLLIEEKSQKQLPLHFEFL